MPMVPCHGRNVSMVNAAVWFERRLPRPLRCRQLLTGARVCVCVCVCVCGRCPRTGMTTSTATAHESPISSSSSTAKTTRNQSRARRRPTVLPASRQLTLAYLLYSSRTLNYSDLRWTCYSLLPQLSKTHFKVFLLIWWILASYFISFLFRRLIYFTYSTWCILVNFLPLNYTYSSLYLRVVNKGS